MIPRARLAIGRLLAEIDKRRKYHEQIEAAPSLTEFVTLAWEDWDVIWPELNSLLTAVPREPPAMINVDALMDVLEEWEADKPDSAPLIDRIETVCAAARKAPDVRPPVSAQPERADDAAIFPLGIEGAKDERHSPRAEAGHRQPEPHDGRGIGNVEADTAAAGVEDARRSNGVGAVRAPARPPLIRIEQTREGLVVFIAAVIDEASTASPTRAQRGNDVGNNRVVPNGEDSGQLPAGAADVDARLRELHPTWQPIESAPKDGRGTVLVAFVEQTARKRPRKSYVGEAEYADDVWWFLGDRNAENGACDPQPTHWMPLPDPPMAGAVARPGDARPPQAKP